MKKRERERWRPERGRESEMCGGGEQRWGQNQRQTGETGTVEGREGQRQRDRDSERERQKQTGKANYGSRKIYKNRALNPRDVALRRGRLR